MTTKVMGAALPMGFNRTPHYTKGLLLVGDAGGMVNPFNGEGIAYAMESAELAADAIAEAHYRGVGTSTAERALQGYPTQLKADLGGYYTLGNVFVKLIGNPRVMSICTKYGLPAQDLDAVHPEAAGQPARQPGRGRHGQDHQRALPDRPRSMSDSSMSTTAADA